MTTPSWVATIADDARVNGSEVMEWLGIAAPATLGRDIQAGKIPKPEYHAWTSSTKGNNRSAYWRVKTIRDWIKAGKPRVAR